MKYYIVFFLSFLSLKTIAQTGHLKEFYPENKLYRKLKVQDVIDSFMIVPANSRIIRYDTSGRKLNSYYYACPGCAAPVQWVSNGDTLTCLQYYGDSMNRKLFSREQFIYNKKGEILHYSICHDPFSSGDGVYARVNNFFYNSTGLFCKMEYTNNNYLIAVDQKMVIAENDVKLNSAIYYTYRKTNNGITIIGKESVGKTDWRFIDTFLYDHNNRLIRTSSFSKQGVVGELVLNNLNMITEYKFRDNSVFTTEYYTHCLAVSPTFGCLTELVSPDIDKRELVFDKKGLLLREYGYYSHNGEKYIISKYDYTFYK
jgi:hypothetical protein